MPICRRPVEPPVVLAEPSPVRLSHYVVSRRIPPRAANDNRRPWSSHVLQWAIVLGIAPTLTAFVFLSGLF